MARSSQSYNYHGANGSIEVKPMQITLPDSLMDPLRVANSAVVGKVSNETYINSEYLTLNWFWVLELRSLLTVRYFNCNPSHITIFL